MTRFATIGEEREILLGTLGIPWIDHRVLCLQRKLALEDPVIGGSQGDAGHRSATVSGHEDVRAHVPDRSTADFMLDFYEGLVRGQDPTAALRASKLHFLASNVPGRDRILRWAPFILVGNPGMRTPHSNQAASAATK